MSITLEAPRLSELAECQSQIPENLDFEPRSTQQFVFTTNYDEILGWALSDPNYKAEQHIRTVPTLSELAKQGDTAYERDIDRQKIPISAPTAKRFSFPAEWRASVQQQSTQLLRSFTGRVEAIHGFLAHVALRENGEGETLIGDCHSSTLKAAQIEEGDMFRMDIKRIAGNVTAMFTKIYLPDRSSEEVASLRARLADLD